MTNNVSPSKPLTIPEVRDITAKLKAANDARYSGSGWLRICPDGTFEYVPIEKMMIWGDPA